MKQKSLVFRSFLYMQAAWFRRATTSTVFARAIERRVDEGVQMSVDTSISKGFGKARLAKQQLQIHLLTA